MFFVEAAPDGDLVRGHCHLLPPIPVQTGAGMTAVWPYLANADDPSAFCAQHKPRVKAVPR